MTGPDAALSWIALGVIAALACLAIVIRIAARAGQSAGGDDGCEGADWGGEGLHNGGDI